MKRDFYGIKIIQIFLAVLKEESITRQAEILRKTPARKLLQEDKENL